MKELKTLCDIEVTQPQAAYAAYTKVFRSQGTPSHSIKPLLRRIGGINILSTEAIQQHKSSTNNTELHVESII